MILQSLVTPTWTPPLAPSASSVGSQADQGPVDQVLISTAAGSSSENQPAGPATATMTFPTGGGQLSPAASMQVVEKIEKAPETQAARQRLDTARSVAEVTPQIIRNEDRVHNSNWGIAIMGAPIVAAMGMLAVPVPAVQLAGLAVGMFGLPIALLAYVTLRKKRGEAKVAEVTAQVQQAKANLDDTRQKVTERVWTEAVNAPPPEPPRTTVGVESGDQVVKIGNLVLPRRQDTTEAPAREQTSAT